jgi:ribosomal protein S3
MARKTNPIVFRLDVTGEWKNTWYGIRNSLVYDHELLKLREYVSTTLSSAGYIVGDILVFLKPSSIEVRCLVASVVPEVKEVIASEEIKVSSKYKNRSRLKIVKSVNRPVSQPLALLQMESDPAVTDNLKVLLLETTKTLQKLFLKTRIAIRPETVIKLQLEQVPWLQFTSTLLANWLAKEIEGNAAISSVTALITTLFDQRKDLLGIKMEISGRIAGVDMARTEVFSLGEVPLQTISSILTYSTATAFTGSGTIGIKVTFAYRPRDNNEYKLSRQIIRTIDNKTYPEKVRQAKLSLNSITDNFAKVIRQSKPILKLKS